LQRAHHGLRCGTVHARLAQMVNTAVVAGRA